MEKIAYGTNRKDLKEIYAELNFLDYTDDREEKEKKLIAEFRAKL